MQNHEFFKDLFGPFAFSYREKMRIRSERFRDQPEKPLTRAVWWVEYILRNPNPEHLKSPVLQLGAFAANSYDIILFFIVLTVLFVFVVRKCVVRLFMVCRKKEKNL